MTINQKLVPHEPAVISQSYSERQYWSALSRNALETIPEVAFSEHDIVIHVGQKRILFATSADTVREVLQDCASFDVSDFQVRSMTPVFPGALVASRGRPCKSQKAAIGLKLKAWDSARFLDAAVSALQRQLVSEDRCFELITPLPVMEQACLAGFANGFFHGTTMPVPHEVETFFRAQSAELSRLSLLDAVGLPWWLNQRSIRLKWRNRRSVARVLAWLGQEPDKNEFGWILNLLSGYSSSALSTTWSLYHLAGDQAALAEFEKSLIGSSKYSFEQLIEAVMRESRRLSPPFPFLLRQAKVAWRFGLRPGDIAVVSPWLIHRHRLNWPDRPDTFDFKRFLDRDKHHTHYLPFGFGVRRCPGSQIADQSQISLMSAVLQLGLPAYQPAPEPVADFMVRPASMPAIRLHPPGARVE